MYTSNHNLRNGNYSGIREVSDGMPKRAEVANHVSISILINIIRVYLYQG